LIAQMIMERTVLFPLGILCLTVLLFIFLLKRLNQPYLVAYILAGIMLGPHAAGIFTDTGNIDWLGEIGIILMMFFLGLEIKIPDYKTMLVQPVIAQGFKTALSILAASCLGLAMKWGLVQVFLVSVLFMFNSTAVVSSYLQKTGELHARPGTVILNMLLLQDMLFVPVLAILQFFQHTQPDFAKLAVAAAGSILAVFLLRATRHKDFFRLPFGIDIKSDHDLQVFAGALICFGFGMLAATAGLAPSIGSFFAGIFMSRTPDFDWLDRALHPFKVFFTAFFFVSIGLRIDLIYIGQHTAFVTLITGVVLLINSILSAVVFRALRYNKRSSLYAGALLSQTGEFSLLACAAAYQQHIIDAGLYKLITTIACLSLLLSTVWITMLRQWIYRNRAMSE